MLGNSFDGPFFWSLQWEMWPEVDLKHFKHQKNIFWGSRKSIWGPKSGLKMPISVNNQFNLIYISKVYIAYRNWPFWDPKLIF